MASHRIEIGLGGTADSQAGLCEGRSAPKMGVPPGGDRTGVYLEVQTAGPRGTVSAAPDPRLGVAARRRHPAGPLPQSQVDTPPSCHCPAALTANSADANKEGHERAPKAQGRSPDH